MAVFLTVLKVIGIVLLSILGLALFILLLVLFVPIRYEGNGYYKEKDYDAFAKVTWLLHIVSVRYLLKEEDNLIIKIFGIRFNKKKKKKDLYDEETEEDEDYIFDPESISLPDLSGSSSESIKEEALSISDQKEEIKEVVTQKPEEEAKEEAKEEPKEESKEKPEEELKEEVKEEQDKETVKEKKKHKFKDDKPERSGEEKKDSTSKSFYDKLKAYIEIIKSDSFKNSFELCKKQIAKLLKAVLPKRWNIDGTLGFDDPATTGKVAAIYGSLIYFIGDHIHITADFDDPVIDVKADAKGRIFIITLVVVFIRVWFNKNIKKLIGMLRSVD